ncbi:hypothetical protein [uncultured Paenibacillus sp.]|uniref:hypothetical protein n=1 Tax=uncultured Paenibacillus sp. TaxID=227322 RepID=UPI0028D7ADBB|nr:hypothetical protein [uncultured Paenibacillus sp.]
MIKVTVLTQKSCAFCDDAEVLFERLKMDYPLSISFIDLSSPEGHELAVEGGVLFPPGIFLEERLFSDGPPSERKLRSEIERRLCILKGSPSDQ